jgi:glutathione peroxidase
MFTKTAVRGSDANPLFKELAAKTGKAPLWNFYKYLVGRDGQVVAAYGSTTAPEDAAFVKALERQLGTR